MLAMEQEMNILKQENAELKGIIVDHTQQCPLL